MKDALRLAAWLIVGIYMLNSVLAFFGVDTGPPSDSLLWLAVAIVTYKVLLGGEQ